MKINDALNEIERLQKELAAAKLIIVDNRLTRENNQRFKFK